MADVWSTDQFNVWHVRQEWRTYLQAAGVHGFRTGGDAPLKVCAFCDAVSVNGLGTCSQCGGPLGRASGTRIGEMVLRTIMPLNCDILTTLHSGDRIELHHAFCGRRDDYDNGRIVAALVVDDIEGPLFGGTLGGWDNCDAAELEVRLTGPVGFDFTTEAG